MIKVEKCHYIWFNKSVLKEGRRNPEQNSKFNIGSKNTHSSPQWCSSVLSLVKRVTQTKHSQTCCISFWALPNYNTDYSLYTCRGRLHIFFKFKIPGFWSFILKINMRRKIFPLSSILLISPHIFTRHNNSDFQKMGLTVDMYFEH